MHSEREPLLYNSKNKEYEGKVKKRNIFVLGLGFFFVYTGYLTAAGTSETMLRSYSYRTGESSNGFISLGINAALNGLSAPFVPILFRLLSRRTTMFLGALLNASYVFCFIHPSPELLYLFSAVSGIGGTLLWVSQGADLVVNSTPETISKNTAIFFSFYMSGMFGGNLFVYFDWNGQEFVTQSQQSSLAIILGIITTVGGFIFLFSKPEAQLSPRPSSFSILSECKSNFLSAFRMSKKLPVQLLMPAMALLGFEIAFYQLAMPTCIGTTHELDDPKGSIGLVMIFLGAGELLGTICQLLPSKLSPMDSRIVQITVATILYILASATSFCMFPEECTIHETYSQGMIKPHLWILLVCAVAFGFYDCTMQMCINQMFGTLFRSEEDSGGFYVLVNIILCATLTAGFIYAPFLTLPVQICINLSICLVATCCILRMDHMMRNNLFI